MDKCMKLFVFIKLLILIVGLFHCAFFFLPTIYIFFVDWRDKKLMLRWISGYGQNKQRRLGMENTRT